MTGRRRLFTLGRTAVPIGVRRLNRSVINIIRIVRNFGRQDGQRHGPSAHFFRRRISDRRIKQHFHRQSRMNNGKTLQHFNGRLTNVRRFTHFNT